MLAKDLDDLVVYHASHRLSDAVSAMLQRPGVREDWELRKQLASAAAAIPANIAEGFGQQSDRQFARYLFLSRGSASEVRAHLRIAQGRSHLSEQEWTQLDRECVSICRMLSALIRYLRASDRKERG